MFKRLLAAALSLLFAAGLYLSFCAFAEETGAASAEGAADTEGAAGAESAEGAASGEKSDEAEAEPEPETENILVIKNLNTGNNLRLKSAKSRVFQAGVAARLMTALLAYEEIEDLSAAISVPFCASDAKLRGGGSYIGFSYSEDEEPLTLGDLLTAATVSSATDACLSLAVASSRRKAGESLSYPHDRQGAAAASVRERAQINDFVERMNARAVGLGCKDTRFTNCTGVPDERSKTTAEDLAAIAAAVCAHGKLLELTDKPYYTLSTGSRQIYTKNALKSEYMLKGCRLDGVKGMIVGYLQGPDAFCVVTTAEERGLSYVFVCVNTKPSAAGEGGKNYAAEISAYKTIGGFKGWALKSFEYKLAVSPLEPVAMAPVKAGKGKDSVAIVPKNSVELLVTKDVDFENDVSCEYLDMEGRAFSASELGLTAPVAAGQEVGKVLVYLKGELVGESPLVTNIAIAKSGALSALDKAQNFLNGEMMKKVYKWALIIFAAYLAIVFLAFVYRIVRKYIDAGRSE